jgi:hypothetical protein
MQGFRGLQQIQQQSAPYMHSAKIPFVVADRCSRRVRRAQQTTESERGSLPGQKPRKRFWRRISVFSNQTGILKMPYKFSVQRNDISFVNGGDLLRTARLTKDISVDDPRDASALIAVYEIRHRLPRIKAAQHIGLQWGE